MSSVQRPGQPKAPKTTSAIERFTNSPGFPIILNIAFFVAGVAFIQSPAMDSLAPQL